MRFERQPEVVTRIQRVLGDELPKIFLKLVLWAEDVSVYAAQRIGSRSMPIQFQMENGMSGKAWPYGHLRILSIEWRGCLTLRTRVTFAKAGRYDVVLSLGDTGASDPAENLTTQTPLMFALQGQSWVRWCNDGVFRDTWLQIMKWLWNS